MKKQCKRKHYKLVNPIAYAIAGAIPPSGDKLKTLQIIELSAIESFRTGIATVNDWSKLVAMMNLCENMAANGIGPEAMPICEQAHQYLITAAKRYETTGKMEITGPGLKCLRDLYEFHDLQRTSVATSVYEKHIQDTINRVRSKAPEVVDVLEIA